MSEPTRLTPEQVEELLALRAAEGLDDADQRLYDRLVAEDPSLAREAEAIELAAAGAAVALHHRYGDTQAALPDALRVRMLADAAQHTGRADTPQLKLADTPPTAQSPKAPAEPGGSPLFSRAALGWYAAAAAAIALVFYIGNQAPDTPETISPRQQYAALKAEPATVTAAWNYNADGGESRFASTAGEVIFNPDTQTGYMKLSGLPVNDPTKEQYQLWIVDATRTDRENTDRVDGGVFNITADGEALIPIDAKIDARRPVAFAITVETPGGVVESKGPLQALAIVE